MARSIEDIKNTVKALLDRAADQDGKPEADLCRDKAFSMMARYAIEERDLNAPDEGDEVIVTEIKLSGAYTDCQNLLVAAIAKALHCQSLSQGIYRSTKIKSVYLFGARRHVERVELLFSLLNPQMVTLAVKNMDGDPFASEIVRKRSFMRGFATRVMERLDNVEREVNAGESSGYAVALIDDDERARALRDQWLKETGQKIHNKERKRQFDGYAYGAGNTAADGTDIGQTRVKNRAALPA